MVGGAMGRVVQRRILDRHQFHQVAQHQHPVDVEYVLAFVKPQLEGEHPAMRRLHPFAYFEADDGSEAPVAQLRLDHREQVVGFLLVALGVGVAGDAEELARLDRHVGEEQVEVVRDHVLQGHEMQARAGANKARDAGAQGHLDARDQLVAALRVAQADQQVVREVGDEWKGVGGVHRQRRYQRENVLEIVLAYLGALLFGQFLVGDQPDVMLAERIEDVLEDHALSLLEAPDVRVAFRDLLARRAPIGRHLLHPGDHLLLEAADPLHEKFIQVGSGNRQKFEPLKQRVAPIVGLGQHPPVKRQPGQLAVEIELRTVQVGSNLWRDGFRNRRSDRRRSRGRGCGSGRDRLRGRDLNRCGA